MTKWFPLKPRVQAKMSCMYHIAMCVCKCVYIYITARNTQTYEESPRCGNLWSWNLHSSLNIPTFGVPSGWHHLDLVTLTRRSPNQRLRSIAVLAAGVRWRGGVSEAKQTVEVSSGCVQRMVHPINPGHGFPHTNYWPLLITISIDHY